MSKTKVVCPTAPTRPVRLNMGMSMPAWFDLPPMGPEMLTSIDWEGVASSTRQVHAILEREIAAGVPSDKIIVGGFSQGGCLALRAALSFPKVRGASRAPGRLLASLSHEDGHLRRMCVKLCVFECYSHWGV